MIQVERKVWDGIPVLICVKESHKEIALPVVTYLHGITGAKEDNLSIGYLLAEKNFRVILPDAHLHGEREQPDIDHLSFHFFDIVQKSIAELELIYQSLDELNLIEGQPFSLAGTSMGGITTAAALTCYPWVAQAGIMMGTAMLHSFSEGVIKQTLEQGIKLPMSDEEIADLLDKLKQFDLSINIDKLQNRPLFIWHGEEDDVVPYHLAKAFYDQLEHEFADKNTTTFVNEERTGHKVTRQARIALVDWFVNSINEFTK